MEERKTRRGRKIAQNGGKVMQGEGVKGEEGGKEGKKKKKRVNGRKEDQKMQKVCLEWRENKARGKNMYVCEVISDKYLFKKLNIKENLVFYIYIH